MAEVGFRADPAGAAADAGTSLRPGEADVLADAADFRQHRIGLQDEQVARLSELLPLPQVRLPFLFEAEIGPAEVDLLGGGVLDGVECLDAEVQLGVGT